MKNGIHSLTHTKWNCKYHIVFAPKYRRRVFYGEKREAVGKILRTLCAWKEIKIVEAEVCPDHVYMLFRDTAQSGGIEFHGISEREGQLDDLRTVSGVEIQVQESGNLVSRVLY